MPSRSFLAKRSRRSFGYSPLASISAERGSTFSLTSLRTVSRIICSASSISALRSGASIGVWPPACSPPLLSAGPASRGRDYILTRKLRSIAFAYSAPTSCPRDAEKVGFRAAQNAVHCDRRTPQQASQPAHPPCAARGHRRDLGVLAAALLRLRAVGRRRPQSRRPRAGACHHPRRALRHEH